MWSFPVLNLMIRVDSFVVNTLSPFIKATTSFQATQTLKANPYASFDVRTGLNGNLRFATDRRKSNSLWLSVARLRGDCFAVSSFPKPPLQRGANTRMRLVFVSDTHNKLGKVKVPDGDMLFHCGDFTMKGDLGQVQAFNNELGALPHPFKVVVAGNHDFPFEKQNAEARAALTNAVYLQDELAVVNGLRIYGL